MSSRVVSRRNVVLGGAAGASAFALAGCRDDGRADTILVRRAHSLPDDPTDRLWEATPLHSIALGPQNLALPQRLTPAVTSVRVGARHDGERLGFVMEWDDLDTDDLTVRAEDFRDACAVLLAPGEGDAAIRAMGSATVPATLLHWKADWQRDIDRGRQGIEHVYPNRSVDVYPPLPVAPDEVRIESYQEAGATVWLPGMHVGNPLSAPEHPSPVEKLIAYGFGTSVSAVTQDARGRGARTDTGWRVVLTKPLTAADDGETSLAPGQTASAAFAVWSGSGGDSGGRKAPSLAVSALVLGR